MSVGGGRCAWRWGRLVLWCPPLFPLLPLGIQGPFVPSYSVLRALAATVEAAGGAGLARRLGGRAMWGAAALLPTGTLVLLERFEGRISSVWTLQV